MNTLKTASLVSRAAFGELLGLVRGVSEVLSALSGTAFPCVGVSALFPVPFYEKETNYKLL